MAARIIAVDLDDTLNNFTETLQSTPFEREPTEPVSETAYGDYLRQVRGLDPDEGDLLSTEYTFFRARIHLRCFRLARPRLGAVPFMQRLRQDGWRIVICTQRDLRRSHDLTRDWLQTHGIPFDHLFMAANKIVFCRLWGIPLLVDDDLFQIAHGATYGVQVFYPAMNKHAELGSTGARGFNSFAELYPWIDAPS